MNSILEAQHVFDIEIEALKCTRDSLGKPFEQILELVTKCTGKVIITGMGKPGHIATKLAATFSSLGTPSFYLHPAEAQHGDLGMVRSDDVVIAISYSGESDEVVRIIPNLKMIGVKIIVITGNAQSTLAKNADVVQVFPEFKEACYLGLAPTSSTTVALCYGDALAVVASGVYAFQDVDFGRYHPAGSLGKKLILKVEDLMVKGDNNSIVKINSTLKDVIVEMNKKLIGIVCVNSEQGELCGIITDGDIRRQLEKEKNIYQMYAEDIMTKQPICIQTGKMAVDALNTMKKYRINALPVMKKEKTMGIIRLQEIVNKGII